MGIVNYFLDKLIRPEVNLFHRPRSAFKVCGCIGLLLAILFSMMAGTHFGLSPWIMIGLILVAVLTFFVLVMGTKVITGEEKIVYYHHVIAVMLVSALMLRLLRQPVLPYLDVMILGIGLFLVCGRVGCLMVGCCHGRPNRWGVCYRHEHAMAGFTPYFVGVKLFPIQAVESLWVFGIVIVGSTLILNGHRPGEALAWYVVTYGLGRFCIEFGRCDPERPYYLGFSQAQWISFFLMTGVSWAETVSILPFYSWHVAVTVFLILIMFALFLKRRFQKTSLYWRLNPYHIKEVAEAMQRISDSLVERTQPSEPETIPKNIRVVSTSLDIQISGGKIKDRANSIHHFALSSRNDMMDEKAAWMLSELILKFNYSFGLVELVNGSQGVFHVLIAPNNRRQ
jgi:hypothetical protein